MDDTRQHWEVDDHELREPTSMRDNRLEEAAEQYASTSKVVFYELEPQVDRCE